MSEKVFVDENYPIDKIVSVLKNDGIVIMPSDTVYGFLFTQKAAEKVREIKRRDNKPFLFFIGNINQLEELNVNYRPFVDVLEKNWIFKTVPITSSDLPCFFIEKPENATESNKSTQTKRFIFII